MSQNHNHVQIRFFSISFRLSFFVNRTFLHNLIHLNEFHAIFEKLNIFFMYLTISERILACFRMIHIDNNILPGPKIGILVKKIILEKLIFVGFFSFLVGSESHLDISPRGPVRA